MKRIILILLIFAFNIIMISCGNSGIKTLEVISGSENETLEPLLKHFERKSGIRINMHYKGSVDIMLELQDGEIPYDAVWPANSLWISLGDLQRKVKHTSSIMNSPVVFGIRKNIAENLDFINRKVYVADILKAIEENSFSFMMTSATQSNSGASAYLGFLYALAGNPDVLTSQDLQNPQLKKSIRGILSGVNRSSGSSGWLKDLFLESNYDAMVNYEALIIETNQELEKRGEEPLYIVYPVDGIVIADSPLGFVDNGITGKEEAFLKLQEFLLSKESQKKISDTGRRTGMGALAEETDPRVFRREWGIDTDMILSPFRIPSGEVIAEALNMYQLELRKPSYTIYCLDYSGSMLNSGEKDMKAAMETLLNQENAGEYLIQTGEDDISVVLPFSTAVLDTWLVNGNKQEDLLELNRKISQMVPKGGTDIYTPVIAGLKILSKVKNLNSFQPAIILLTDGESNNGRSYNDFTMAYDQYGLDVPVFSIVFGAAKEEQLVEIAEYSSARVFDGKSDLIGTFRKAKGYN